MTLEKLPPLDLRSMEHYLRTIVIRSARPEFQCETSSQRYRLGLTLAHESERIPSNRNLSFPADGTSQHTVIAENAQLTACEQGENLKVLSLRR